MIIRITGLSCIYHVHGGSINMKKSFGLVNSSRKRKPKKEPQNNNLLDGFLENGKNTKNSNYDDTALRDILKDIETRSVKIISKLPIYSCYFLRKLCEHKNIFKNSFSALLDLELITKKSKNKILTELGETFIEELKIELDKKTINKDIESHFLFLKPTRECMLDLIDSIKNDVLEYIRMIEMYGFKEIHMAGNTIQEDEDLNNKFLELENKLSDLMNKDIFRFLRKAYKILDYNNDTKCKVASDIFSHEANYIFNIVTKINRKGTQAEEIKSFIVENIYSAIDKFDISAEIKFTTYCYAWIQNGVFSWIKTINNHCKLPDYISRKISPILKSINEVGLIDITQPDIKRIAKINKCTEEDVVTVLNVIQHNSSNKQLYGRDRELSNSTIEDMSTYEESYSQEEHAINLEISRKIKTILSNGSFNEEEIAVLIYEYPISISCESNLDVGLIPKKQRTKILKCALKKLKKYYPLKELSRG